MDIEDKVGDLVLRHPVTGYPTRISQSTKQDFQQLLDVLNLLMSCLKKILHIMPAIAREKEETERLIPFYIADYKEWEAKEADNDDEFSNVPVSVFDDAREMLVRKHAT